MNIQTNIPEDLWHALKANYEKKEYSNAILDSFYHLSDLIREKSGCEGDGSSLIGSALGGQNPKIKLNRFQSESEINFQKGIEQTIRGLYLSIRNPRSHEKFQDTEEDANLIILFIGYLSRNINNAKSRFSKNEFIKRVIDQDFVQEQRYADLLVEEIPDNQLFHVFLESYRLKTKANIYALGYFYKSLLKRISEDDKERIYEIVSEDLKTSNDEVEIIRAIASLGGEIWPNISTITRLRIENKVIKSIKEGVYNEKTERCECGVLGTWGSNIYYHFTLKNEITFAIQRKLQSNNRKQIDYILKYVFNNSNKIFKTTPKSIIYALKNLIDRGDKKTYDSVKLFYFSEDECPEELKDSLDNFSENILIFENSDLDDDIPF